MRWVWGGLNDLGGNSVVNGSLGEAYFYHTSELTSNTEVRWVWGVLGRKYVVSGSF